MRWQTLLQQAFAGVLLCAGVQAHAQLAVDVGEAMKLAAEASGSVRGAQLDAQARGLQAEALDRLGGPSLSLTGFAGRVSTSINLDLSNVAAAANPSLGMLDAALPGAPIPTIPNAYTTDRIVNLVSAGLGSVWPIYTGGRVEALQGLARGRAREAQAEQQDAEDKLATQVAQRYFTVQLARQALALRSDAVIGIGAHQQSALKLEQAGLIARAERLRADVALDNARRDEARARSDLQLAEVALQRLLRTDAPVQATTPLFVHSQGVGPLASFIDTGMSRHPAWQKLAAKRDQADESYRLQGTELAPNVVALANVNLNRSNDKTVQPNWQVGVHMSLPLVSRIDHDKMRDAARLQQQRVEVSAEQAGRDIPTLVEAQWRALENARAQYVSGGSAVELATEHLRLQQVSFAQSQATSTDVTDAQLGLSRSKIERLQAAHDYVMALARLLEASGQPQRLPELAASADIRLPLQP